MRLLRSSVLVALLASSAAGCMDVTPWVNADDPYSGDGDHETVGYNNQAEGGEVGRVTKDLEKKGIFCSNPIRAMCRNVKTRKVWYLDSKLVNTNLNRINCDISGLTCLKKQWSDGKCPDYEVSLWCWRPCDGTLEWSKWKNNDSPSGKGDYEQPGMQGHPNLDNVACPSGISPLEIQCETVDGVPASLAGNDKIKCDVINGFSCVNSEQPKGKRCLDYRVRYLCIKSTDPMRLTLRSAAGNSGAKKTG